MTFQMYNCEFWLRNAYISTKFFVFLVFISWEHSYYTPGQAPSVYFDPFLFWFQCCFKFYRILAGMCKRRGILPVILWLSESLFWDINLLRCLKFKIYLTLGWNLKKKLEVGLEVVQPGPGVVHSKISSTVFSVCVVYWAWLRRKN